MHDRSLTLVLFSSLVRAAEVLLGPVSAEPTDMWSVGLVAAELTLRYPLLNREPGM